MKINTLGQLLKYYRKKYNLQQEKICSGICSLATLSKVESGSRIFDSLNAECLLGRIGKEVLQFEIILNDDDYAMWNLREEIQKYEKENNYPKVKELLAIYENLIKKEDSVHQQFLLFQKAKIRMAENEPVEEINVLLYDALKCTKPEIDSSNEMNLLYNPIEVKLVLHLIQNNFFGWASRNKEAELLKLSDFVRKVYTGRQFEETIIDILLCLIEVEFQAQDYFSVIKYADEAIEIISRGRGIAHLAELHFIKAQAMYAIYFGRGEWNLYGKVCRQECLMAYYVFEVFGQAKEMEEVQKFCEEKLEWQIIE